MTPRTLFRGVATAEAFTWAGLLAGMWFKYVPEGSLQGDLGVGVFGPIHGVAFIAFCLGTIAVGVDQQWRTRRLLLGLLSAIPPFATLVFEWYVERRGGLLPRWRLVATDPTTLPERVTAWLVRRPGQGALVGVAAVGVLTTAALVVGPPA